MIVQRTKSLLKENWIFYLTGAILVLGLKVFYSQADTGQLKWILAPVSRWVSILSGLSFEYIPDVGFVNHDIRFIIASSCSGVQFMLIAIATLIFSFVHRMKSSRNRFMGFYWIIFSITAAYSFTILINGFRIVLSIYLPVFLEKSGFTYRGWLTPDSLHTLIGTVIYFSSLLVLYQLADSLSGVKIKAEHSTGKSHLPLFVKCLPPLFWYFSIVLGIPFLNRAVKNDYNKFGSFAALISGVCLLLFSLYFLLCAIKKRHAAPKPASPSARSDS